MHSSRFVLVVSACPGFGLTYADAADMVVKAPVAAPIAAAPYNWSGLYVGGNFGGTWSNGIANIAGTAWDPGATAFIGGLQLGYNWQAGIFLFGVEGDFDRSVFNRPNAPLPTAIGSVQASAHQDWIGTLAARFGLTWDKWLAYGKVGGGWARDTTTLGIANGTNWAGSNSDGGWLAGAGIEYAFKPNWTVKLEYDFLGLGNWTTSAAPPAVWSRDIQMIKMGMNYKFESGTPAPATKRAGAEKPESDEDRENLAKAAQNPIADMISVPFQNNANFHVGPFNRTQDVLNIQPVVPLHLGSDWIVISRTIVPLTNQPDPVFDSSTYGIGDTSQSLLLSPVSSGIKDFSWGLGPIVTVPTASNVLLGTGKLLLGPEAVVIYTPGHWVIGAVVSNSWSVDGDPLRKSVNLFNTQPFINYNIPKGQGWYLTSSPIITADWNAPPGQKWTVPVGGGLGRVFKVAGQAFNAQAQAFYNVVRAGPNSISTPGDWQFRFELQMLFPE
jgi:opacity protein-like surface antigen